MVYDNFRVRKMIMKNHNQRVTDEYMLSKIFSRLVIVGFVQFLILSVTGIVDSCFTGQFIGSDALGGMRLAMPIFSIYLIFTQIMCSGLSVVATKMLGEGKREQAVKCFGNSTYRS
jgi:Na+-driven multidrug efflux pump